MTAHGEPPRRRRGSGAGENREQGGRIVEYAEVVRRLAPCGLDCSRCLDHEGGEIRRLATRLIDLLGDYERVALLKADAEPAFRRYPEFRALLAKIAEGPCGGCRSGRLHSPVACAVRACSGEKGVDFCFQCRDFPCGTGLSVPLGERWKTRNERMREICVEAFYEEQSARPRY